MKHYENSVAQPLWAGYPYSHRETLNVLWYNIFGPTSKNKTLTQWIDQKSILNEINPQMTLLFLGDFLSIKSSDLVFDDALLAMAASSDYLVVNLEGLVCASGKKAMFSQENNIDKLMQLTALKPAEQIILSIANNHSADFGRESFDQCLALIQAKGFNFIGSRDKPTHDLSDEVSISATTDVSNFPQDFLAEIDAVQPKAKFNILYPHWGREMELFPRPDQISRATSLLSEWDMIIGHHAHVPQPITSYPAGSVNKLVAYSLGDFAIQFPYKHYRHGCVVQANIGPLADNSNEWAVGEVTWKYVYNDVQKTETRITLAETCHYFE